MERSRRVLLALATAVGILVPNSGLADQEVRTAPYDGATTDQRCLVAACTFDVVADKQTGHLRTEARVEGLAGGLAPGYELATALSNVSVSRQTTTDLQSILVQTTVHINQAATTDSGLLRHAAGLDGNARGEIQLSAQHSSCVYCPYFSNRALIEYGNFAPNELPKPGDDVTLSVLMTNHNEPLPAGMLTIQVGLYLEERLGDLTVSDGSVDSIMDVTVDSIRTRTLEPPSGGIVESLHAPYLDGYTSSQCSRPGLILSNCSDESQSEFSDGSLGGAVEVGSQFLLAGSGYGEFTPVLYAEHTLAQAVDQVTYTLLVRVHDAVIPTRSGNGDAGVSINAYAYTDQEDGGSTYAQLVNTSSGIRHIHEKDVTLRFTLASSHSDQIAPGKIFLGLQLYGDVYLNGQGKVSANASVQLLRVDIQY